MMLTSTVIFIFLNILLVDANIERNAGHDVVGAINHTTTKARSGVAGSPTSTADTSEVLGPYYVVKNHTKTQQLYADVADTAQGLEETNGVTKVSCHLLNPLTVHTIISCKNPKVHLQIKASVRPSDGKIIYTDAFGKEQSVIQDNGGTVNPTATTSTSTPNTDDKNDESDVVPDEMEDGDTNFYYFSSKNMWIIFSVSFAVVSIIVFFMFCSCCCCCQRDDDDDSDDSDDYNDRKSVASTKSSDMEEVWSYGRRMSFDRTMDHSANLHDIDLSLGEPFDRLHEDFGRIQEVKSSNNKQQKKKYKPTLQRYA